MTNAQKKKCARELFFSHRSQKYISELLGIAEPTMSKWVNKEGWAEERAEAASFRKSITNRILKRVDYNLRVLENTQDPQAMKPDDKGVIDGLSKLFSGIKGKEMTIQQQLICLTNFLEFAQASEFDATKRLIALVQPYLERQHNHD